MTVYRSVYSEYMFGCMDTLNQYNDWLLDGRPTNRGQCRKEQKDQMCPHTGTFRQAVGPNKPPIHSNK